LKAASSKIELIRDIMPLKIYTKFEENWINISKVIIRKPNSVRRTDRQGDYYRAPASRMRGPNKVRLQLMSIQITMLNWEGNYMITKNV
jgi:hypothetical protein